MPHAQTSRLTPHTERARCWPVSDPAGNPNAGSSSTDNQVMFDPVVPIVTGIVRADPNPTAVATVVFAVTFSKDVTGVDASDFAEALATLESCFFVNYLYGTECCHERE